MMIPAQWPAGRWAHGTTHAVAAWPDPIGGVWARISVATIAGAGPFSRFAGCDRWLHVLDDGGGLQLGARSLATGDTHVFSGDDTISATPDRTATVLNLIVQRAIAWDARVEVAAIDRSFAPGVVACLTVAPLAATIATPSAPLHVRAAGPAIAIHLGLDVVAVDAWHDDLAAVTRPTVLAVTATGAARAAIVDGVRRANRARAARGEAPAIALDLTGA